MDCSMWKPIKGQLDIRKKSKERTKTKSNIHCGGELWREVDVHQSK